MLQNVVVNTYIPLSVIMHLIQLYEAGIIIIFFLV